jgi:hypothetical protein
MSEVYKLGGGGAGAVGGLATPAGGSPAPDFPAGAVDGPAVGSGSGLSGIDDELSGPPQPTTAAETSDSTNILKIQFLTETSRDKGGRNATNPAGWTA